jgi:hypothetical protein
MCTEDKIDVSKDSFYKEQECVFSHFPKYCLKILLGDLYAKVRRHLFKPTSPEGHLMPRLRICGAIPLLPQYSWHFVRHRGNFNLTFP